MKIHILPKILQHKIAAGEVIERPASIVKELVENSLDAGASFVKVELVGGGLDRIVVTDDGCGIGRDDVKLAFERYATSKITEEQDLFHIGTFGFRGEALASIAAVSAVTLETKTEEETVGTRLVMVGGNQEELGDAASPKGTQIVVSKLFFNTPVRRKYLKTVLTENNHCIQAVEDQALSHPGVAFEMVSNTKVLFRSAGTESWASRVRDILGQEWVDSVLPVDYTFGPYQMRGFLGRPEAAREHRRHQYLYVNGRRVNDYLSVYHVKHAYSTLLEKHLNPIFLLDLTMPTESVDINVHPRKAEVKFQQSKEIYQLVEDGVALTLQQNNLVPRAKIGEEQGAGSLEFGAGSLERGNAAGGAGYESGPPVTQGIASQQAGMDYTNQSFGQRGIGAMPLVRQGYEGMNAGQDMPWQAPTQTTVPLPMGNEMQAMLQLYATFIVADKAGEIYLIDQHAAQERVMYERLMARYEHKGSAGNQPLLLPQHIELEAQEMAVVSESFDFLQTLGIEAEEFGEREIVVRSVPLELAKADMSALIKEFVSALIEERHGKQIDAKIAERIIMRSCKVSIKANERLEIGRMQKIVDALLVCEQPYTCPHGRPTMVKLTREELEKIFKRR